MDAKPNNLIQNSELRRSGWEKLSTGCGKGEMEERKRGRKDHRLRRMQETG